MTDKDQVAKFREVIFREYFQRQQEHLNDMVEPKEDYLVDIFESAVDTFSENLVGILSKKFSGKKRDEKIKEAILLLNRIKPLFTLSSKAEKRFGKSYSYARDNFINNCISYGVYGGAFVPGEQLEKLPKTIPVTFCPSYLAEIYVDEKIQEKRDEIYFHMLMVITHELGHIFGPKRFQAFSPERASETLLCMSYHYPGAWKTKGFLPDYKDEIMADIFASRSVSKELLKRNYSKMKKLKLLTSSYKSLCGSSDDGSHPSGSFRLNEILLRQPEVFKMFGCKKHIKKQITSCSTGRPKILTSIE